MAAGSGARVPEAYRIEERIGSGSVSEVWRARAPDGAIVAIKQLRPELAGQRRAHELLKREHRLLEHATHPAIVASSGFVAAERLEPAARRVSPAIVLEWLGGGDLVSLAGADPKHWVNAAIDMTAALRHLHGLGIVHGDVKARNVLFDEHDRARLVDFSCAMPAGTKLEHAIGTASQQKPRSGSHIVSEDDDIFAFAALLYELLAGQAPFVAAAGEWPGHGESSSAIDKLRRFVAKLLNRVARTVPRDLDEIGERLLAVRREQAGAFVEDDGE